jgi:hypothetical protein
VDREGFTERRATNETDHSVKLGMVITGPHNTPVSSRLTRASNTHTTHIHTHTPHLSLSLSLSPAMGDAHNNDGQRATSPFVVDRVLLSRREAALLRRLETEYTPELLGSVLAPLVTHTSPVSLRLLDWTVVNWSKKHTIFCASVVPGRVTNMHDAYKKALAHWKRRLFDPFRRRMRIGVRVKGEELRTTLGQANFALWTYKTGVLSFVLAHREAIEADMNNVSRRHKRDKKEEERRTGGKGKRSQMTSSAGRVSCVAYRAPCTIVFE